LKTRLRALVLPENQDQAKHISPMFESAGFNPAFFWVLNRFLLDADANGI
jgi:hypothetical protein